MKWSLRWALFLALLAASVALTILFWPNGAFLFLVFPFFFRRGRAVKPTEERSCPRCGWTTLDADARFCPRDGEALKSSGAGERF